MMATLQLKAVPLCEKEKTIVPEPTMTSRIKAFDTVTLPDAKGLSAWNFRSCSMSFSSSTIRMNHSKRNVPAVARRFHFSEVDNLVSGFDI